MPCAPRWGKGAEGAPFHGRAPNARSLLAVALEGGRRALLCEEARGREKVGPDAGVVDVLDAVLVAERAHHGRNGGVVAVVDAREEVVLNLEKRGQAEGKGGRGCTVRVSWRV